MKKNKNTILKITLKTKVADDFCDISDLGRFSNTYASAEQAIIHVGEHAGKFVSELPEDYEIPDRGNTLRFFIPAMTGEETGNPDSPKQDYERAKAYGESWWHNGIQAIAKIQLAGGLLQAVSSGAGLCESDLNAADVKEMESNALAELREVLLDLGFSTGEINKAFKTICEIS